VHQCHTKKKTTKNRNRKWIDVKNERKMGEEIEGRHCLSFFVPVGCGWKFLLMLPCMGLNASGSILFQKGQIMGKNQYI